MNAWQLFRQVQFLLKAAVWPTGGKKVFSPEGVIVACDLPDGFLERSRLPCAVIRVGEAQNDPDHDEEPELVSQSFEVTIACSVPNDPWGQSAVLGAVRTQNDSAGKGVLEIEEQLFANLALLGSSTGIRVVLRMKSEAAGTPSGGPEYLAWRGYRFDALVGSARSYPAPTRFSATGGVGSVALAWANPGTRFDSRRIVVRRLAGAVAPATILLGTDVALAANFSTSKTDTVAAGTYSYSVFAVFDEYGTNTDAQSSPPVSKLSVVVT